ncbi:sensor histidine kinase [Streptococcus thoraltensis]|uniref:sensor histidine kinase n=1 Tax=Streptococcus thoraltensis TaxID=55085 RepID=UPI001F5AD79A|nr:HAMP domain-containing sensor histidine kinase [Streptococcus thoraltensis]
MHKYIQQKIHSDNFSPFIHFTAVFTAIFFIMTIIILQIMRLGLYSSTDSSLKQARNVTSTYIDMTMLRTYSFTSVENGIDITIDPIKIKPNDNLVAALDVIVYDKYGNILNTLDAYSKFSKVTLKKSQLNTIVKRKLLNAYGHPENYRSVTLETSEPAYPQAKYISFLASTRQLDEAYDRYVKVVVTVMMIFWFISVITSVYLAKWSRKPIIASYEKQKSFVENASHELRTPLTVLQNRLENLFRKPNDTILDHSENIAASLDEVRNMRLLTTNLLNLARRDDGIHPEIEELAPSFFDDIFNNYQLIAEENGKKLQLTNQISRPLKSDKTLMKQLVTILFDNALKYTGDDDIIAISVENKGRRLLLKVSDNGPGISDNDKQKIFDRFYRVDKARTRQSGGFGLGLSLAKQIVDALGGEISVKDNSPKGTIFEVLI